MSERPKPNPDAQFPPERSRLERDSRFDESAVDALKGSAIWEGPDGPVRIKVDGFAGSHEARPFLDVSRGKTEKLLIPLDQVRFSTKREREIKKTGIDLDVLRHTDYGESPHEYERAYHSAPDKQQKHIVDSAQREAADLMGRAEELYRESELAKVRANIEQSEKYGAKWSERDVRKAEREAVAKLKESPPPEFIDSAQTQLERPEKIQEAIEREVAGEPDEQQDVLREEANRWAEFLEEHGEETGVNERAGEAMDRAKEFEKAFEESPHSPELKDELREKLFDSIEQRARELSGGQLTAKALEAAREWMLELIRTGKPEQYEQTAQDEVLEYGKSRLKVWGKRLFGSFGRALATAAAIAVSVAVPPIGLVALYGGLTALTVEGGRAIYEGAKYQFSRWREEQEQRARERHVREQLT